MDKEPNPDSPKSSEGDEHSVPKSEKTDREGEMHDYSHTRDVQATAREVESSSFNPVKFWHELKKRKVVQVFTTYASVAIGIIYFASATFSYFGIPDWAFQLVTIIVGPVGLPITLLLAWIFELTPDGIKTTNYANQETQAIESPAHTKKRIWFAIGFAATMPTIIFGVLASVFYFKYRGVEEDRIAAEALSAESQKAQYNKSIAVLPLDNLSLDPENAFFADGVQEDIITNLSKVEELLVKSRTSTLRYREPGKGIREIGEELDVRYLVEGSVRRDYNRVQVTVQLIDSVDGGNVWAEKYERNLDDIFAIQATVAKEIARRLQATLSPEEIAKIERRPTDNLEAYEYWVKHRQLIESRDLGNWDEKIALLDKTVATDPDFVEAWAHLAIEYIVKYFNQSPPRDTDLFSKANDAIDVAKRLDPDHAYIPFAQSFLNNYRVTLKEGATEECIDYLLETLARDPSFYEAKRMLADRYARLGRLREAQYFSEEVHRFDPLSERTNAQLLKIYKLNRQWRLAKSLIEQNLNRQSDDQEFYWHFNSLEINYLQDGDSKAFIASMESDYKNEIWFVFTKALIERDLQPVIGIYKDLEARDPDRITSTGLIWGNRLRIRDRLILALALLELGRDIPQLEEIDREIAYLNSQTKDDPVPYAIYLANLVICHALKGDEDSMDAAIERVRKLTALPHYQFNYQSNCEVMIAIAYIVMGDNEKAVDILEAASKEEGDIFLNRELDLWFIFDRLRGNPRFDALLEG